MTIGRDQATAPVSARCAACGSSTWTEVCDYCEGKGAVVDPDVLDRCEWADCGACGGVGVVRYCTADDCEGPVT